MSMTTIESGVVTVGAGHGITLELTRENNLVFHRKTQNTSSSTLLLQGATAQELEGIIDALTQLKIFTR